MRYREIHLLIVSESESVLCAPKDRNKWVNGVPPMRPICPDVCTESTVSGRFVAAHLQPFVERAQTFFKNSYSLIAILKNLRDIPVSAVFMTGDVDSLYPNIPPDGALKAVTDLFSKDVSADLPLTLKGLLWRFCVVRFTAATPSSTANLTYK